ncbi:MAG TPA: hypothetical protein DCF95_10175 [Gammaproteobacteria bacterium]|nr:hypothetical protein [Gammaproteobacteria bacterium]
MHFHWIKDRVKLLLFVGCGLAVNQTASSEMLFEESFDDQPDWTSAMHSSDTAQYADSHIIPEGWYAVRQDPTWAPSTGHPDKHESIEILSSNADKARGGIGKSYVSWRDYHEADWNRWNSDSILAKYFPEGLDEVYVEFYISFSSDWTPEGQSKLFRMTSWSGNPDFFGYGGDRENGPVIFFDYNVTSGVRNFLAFRKGPHGENYGMSNESMGDVPRKLIGSGDYPGNWTSNTVGSTYGEDPQIPDKVNGGYISKDSAYYPSHEQIYGPDRSWTKYAFYVKMNSAPGVRDGVFKQWLDDQLVLETNKVTWVDSNSENKMVKWNVVAIGGNDFWRGDYTNADRREEWYAIDDIVIATRPPEGLGSGGGGFQSPPEPPVDISVE